MNKTDIEVSTYKTHLLLIAKYADELYVMAGHYYKNIPNLGDAEPFVYSALNMSKQIYEIADIDNIRAEVLKTIGDTVDKYPV